MNYAHCIIIALVNCAPATADRHMSMSFADCHFAETNNSASCDVVAVLREITQQQQQPVVMSPAP